MRHPPLMDCCIDSCCAGVQVQCRSQAGRLVWGGDNKPPIEIKVEK